jgi:hypothetical protein
VEDRAPLAPHPPSLDSGVEAAAVEEATRA